MTHEAALETVLAAAAAINATSEPGLRWLHKQLVLTRGYYAPGRFDEDAWVERSDVEAAWDAVKDDLPCRELLESGDELGGHPGGGWYEAVRAHVLPSGGCLYTWETDFADLGRQATLLIATGEEAHGDAVDALVVELALADLLTEPAFEDYDDGEALDAAQPPSG